MLVRSTLYKNADDFCLGRDTFHTESFNNAMNIFQDKRFAFGDTQYLLRANLAILHWNENVGRDFTSVWNPADPGDPVGNGAKRIIHGSSTSIGDSGYGHFGNGT